MKRIELAEETDLILPAGELDREQGLVLTRDHRFELDWPNPGNNFQYRLRSKGWVGHIPFPGLLVVVQPKVPVSSIFGMLEVAYKTKSFHILEGETAVESIEEIYERIASILAKRVNDRFRKGLYRGYIEREDDLEYVRGRVDIRGNLRNAVLTAPRLHCRYEELTADLAENSILLWALYLASRAEFEREDVRRAVRQAYRNLIGSVSLEPKYPRDCIARLYHRLNEDYKPMHALCRFLIEHSGPSTKIGSYEFLPFSLDMPKLFEGFVTEWLRANLPGSLRVDPQYHIKLNANADLSFRVDLVLRQRPNDQAIAVLDVKYKMDETPSQSDITQVVAYAVELGVTRAFLVYPSRLAHPVVIHVGHVMICTVAIDLTRSPSENWPRFRDAILTAA
jgi:5-methylcytosine-specific restriction enzyme subunit McrC